MKKQLKIKTILVLNDFEKISESQEKKIVGGFSQSFSGPTDGLDDGGTTNNCQGGNCRAGCGTGQNIQCNTYQGCGV